MSKIKRGGGADEAYTNHLVGSPFASNPATTRTAILERMYLRLLAELASNRFKWINMPESVDIRFMETVMFYHGLAVFYKDIDFDKYLCLKGTSTTFVNMVDNPTAFVVIGNNFFSKTLGAYNPTKDYEPGEAETKAIPIWANYLRMPDWDIVRIYASRLAELDRTIEINSKNARRNKVIVSSDNTRLSTVNINRQIDEGQNMIHVSADGPAQDLAFVQAFDLNIDVDAIEKLHIVRTRMWNECMGLMGINNANQDKKERLVAAEVDANDDQTDMMRYVNLNARRQAAEYINKVHGLDIAVEYWTDEPVNAPELVTGTSEDETHETDDDETVVE